MKDGLGREIQVDDVIVVCHRKSNRTWQSRYLVTEVQPNRIKAEFGESTVHSAKKRKRTTVWLKTPKNTIVVYPPLPNK